MPPVDLDAFVSACTTATTDRKIACEPLPDDDNNSQSHSRSSDAAGEEEFNEVPPDFPAESFWLSQDAEFDWFDRNAFLERKESTRGNICNSTNPNQSNNTTSQRFSKHLNSKAAILGMPNTQKANHVDNKRRQSKAPIMRLFPSKRSESVKSTAAMAEPSSPKVSCIGRVRSKKGRRRKVTVKAVVERTRSADEVKKKKGFYSGLMSLFRSDRRCTNKNSVSINEPVVKPVCRKKSEVSNGKKCDDSVLVSCESESQPVSLGGMTRFVSGRRSESWIVGEEADVARNDSLEAFRKSGSSRRL
ncbi:Calcium/calmodulin protein kinase 1 [Heracleum sosnowskyi]|uniref:Calcium/calmodulin protein kinase 1 n=1 Tax=Heracleum sosnowskyi TaxID=360622 RepID=A0AAD8N7L2_9APIA|nr:Calcium/calmodulin protein kinase 1 [Heracleum sosnowskyi]